MLPQGDDLPCGVLGRTCPLGGLGRAGVNDSAHPTYGSNDISISRKKVELLQSAIKLSLI